MFTAPISANDINMPRATAEEVYLQIETDLYIAREFLNNFDILYWESVYLWGIDATNYRYYNYRELSYYCMLDKRNEHFLGPQFLTNIL